MHGYTLQVLCCTAILPAICDLLYSVIVKATNYEEAVADYYFLSPVVLILTMVRTYPLDIMNQLSSIIFVQIIAALLVSLEYRRNVRSSGLTVCLWMSLVVYGSIKTWTVMFSTNVR